MPIFSLCNKDHIEHGLKESYPGGGALEKFRQGCSCYILGLEFDKLLFSGLLKMRVIFWGVK